MCNLKALVVINRVILFLRSLALLGLHFSLRVLLGTMVRIGAIGWTLTRAMRTFPFPSMA